MRSTLTPEQNDPHDVLEIAPDVVMVARADKAHDAMSRPSDSQTHMASDFAAGPSVPPVDTTFRPAAVNNVRVPGHQPPIGARAVRAFIGFLLALCIGVAGIVWQAYGDAVKQTAARWTPQFVLTSSLPLEKSGPPEQPNPPAVQASAAKAAVPESVAPATAAASPESAQLLQSMARDLASLKEEIGQLKGNQEQMSRDIAKVSDAKASDVKASEVKASEARASEQNLRPRTSAPLRRWAAAPARRPMPSYPPPQYPAPQAAMAPPPPQAVAPYVPQQVEPQPQARNLPEAELAPRPPMPVR